MWQHRRGFIYSPHCCDKIPDRSDLRKGRFAWAQSLEVQSVAMMKAWWQMHEVASHITPIVRKQKEMCVNSHQPSVFYLV